MREIFAMTTGIAPGHSVRYQLEPSTGMSLMLYTLPGSSHSQFRHVSAFVNHSSHRSDPSLPSP